MSETVLLVQGKYKVYNLCSERLYDASLFEGKVHIVLKYLLEEWKHLNYSNVQAPAVVQYAPIDNL